MSFLTILQRIWQSASQGTHTTSAVTILAVTLLCQPAFAWDSVGHRISAAVAVRFISEDTRDNLLEILSAHPRFQEDFLEQMPGFIQREDIETRTEWLLGQAAYWPDIARSLPNRERRRFNRPDWHYIDGAWVRDSALLAGNSYVDVDAFPERQGEPQSDIASEEDVHNVVTALDYNTRLLSDASIPLPERAVALCWVLHLMGDIHQPLHTGSLYSAHTFAAGDRGGNRIPVALPGNQTGRDLNLHGVWDSALREFGVNESLPPILQQITGFSAPRIQNVSSDWTAWMSESRQFLTSQVYTDAMKAAVREADTHRREEIARPVAVDPGYVARMQQIARLRLGLAGLRLAIWFENDLP